MQQPSEIIAISPRSRGQARAETTARIVAAATAMFAERGYHATTLRDVAAAAGLSTGALFANFSGKDALYIHIHGHPAITPEQGLELRREIGRLSACHQVTA